MFGVNACLGGERQSSGRSRRNGRPRRKPARRDRSRSPAARASAPRGTRRHVRLQARAVSRSGARNEDGSPFAIHVGVSHTVAAGRQRSDRRFEGQRTGGTHASRKRLRGLAVLEIEAEIPGKVSSATRGRTQAAGTDLSWVGEIQIELSVAEALLRVGLGGVAVE